MVEFALLLPLLLALLAVIIEAGLALNAWIRVNTAARDATRFAMDSGRPNDTASLALDKLMGVDFGTSREISGSTNLDVYIVTGSTGAAGTITSWSVDHRYDGNSDSSSPVV
jgi:hypothetical protein